MGTELGNTALSLGRNADAKFRLVALAGARRAENLSCVPDRPRSWILSDLRLPVAANAQPRISESVTRRDAPKDWREVSPVFPARGHQPGKLRGKPPGRRAIPARRDRGIAGEPGGRRRS